MTAPRAKLPARDASTRAVVISQPSRLHVSTTVIGLSRGETKTNAVSVPIFGPAVLRPAASSMVVHEHPGSTEPVATAAGKPDRPLSTRCPQEAGTNVSTAAAVSVPTANHGSTVTIKPAKASPTAVKAFTPLPYAARSPCVRASSAWQRPSSSSAVTQGSAMR